MFRKVITLLISLLLILNSTLSNAFAIWQWNLSNPMAVGASILYDGLKGAVTSSVLITPNATQVAKVLGTGGAGIALSYAVEQLLGAVDWVLDPANNQIKYKVDPNNTGCKFLSLVGGDLRYAACGLPKAFMLYSAAHYGIDALEGYKDFKLTHCVPTNGTDPNNSSIASGRCYFTMTKIDSGQVTTTYENFNATLNPDYSDKQEEAKLPLEVVAQKVIENAENDNLDAQFAVLAAATNILSEAENDDAKAKPIEDELEENKYNTCNPPAGVKFNKVTHYDSHSTDPLKGTHGCMAKTGSSIHWHYSVNHQSSNGKCFLEKHAFGGCGVAPP